MVINARRAAHVNLAIVALILVSLAGCQERRTLATTPNIYLDGRGKDVFDAVPESLRTSDIEILYVTDRSIEKETKIGPKYGYKRDRDMTYGTATVSLTPQPTWEQLVKDSTASPRSQRYELDTTSIKEIGTFRSPLDRMEVKDNKIVLPPSALQQMRNEREHLRAVLEKRLAKTPRKDVFIYVHGFANTFDDAVFRSAEMWHFTGRIGVPIAYTWPAGSPGIFGYFHDRESGEYTVSHFKQFLRYVKDIPSVERIHIIAHSRGTDVVTTALRELNIMVVAKGEDPQKVLKIQTLVLASPDMDYEVFGQRFFAENLVMVPAQTVIYFSPNDKAIWFANWLFSGKSRVGGLSFSDFPQNLRKELSQLDRLQFVSCKVSGHSTSHDYEFANPAVFSDLITLLQKGDGKQLAYQRPLEAALPGLWGIQNDYGLPEKKPSGQSN